MIFRIKIVDKLMPVVFLKKSKNYINYRRSLNKYKQLIMTLWKSIDFILL